ncbi:MAG: chromate efflux transporter [Deltaproteobacteria bacterium]|nr:chromate efflux transporter [Deltaproteobacteria bacterium]
MEQHKVQGGSMNVQSNPAPSTTITFRDAVKFWTKLGFISFGGPAGQIAIMHQEVVERRRWIGENQFLRALNFCMLLPGPEAQQLATYIGWRLHGTWGGIAAGSLFVIPSIFVMLLLSYLAVAHIEAPAVAAAFYGIQPVVVAVVIEAVLHIGKKALKHWVLYVFAALAFVTIYFFKVPFPYIVAAAALSGLLVRQWLPQIFCKGQFDTQARECHAELESSTGQNNTRPSFGHVARVFAVCLMLWAIPVSVLWMWRGGGDTLTQIGLFFTKAAFVTFGGAYAVLTYISDVAVTNGWLTVQQMLIGLGLAESTPGPLIMVTQYVGFIGAWNLPEGLNPLTSGILGALITTYVTFLPCFFFIFAGAPFIEAMAGNQRLQAALTGVTAAVVGVVFNLAVWFGYKVILPNGSVDVFALASAGISLFLLQKFHVPIHYVVPAGAAAGVIRQMVFQ